MRVGARRTVREGGEEAAKLMGGVRLRVRRKQAVAAAAWALAEAGVKAAPVAVEQIPERHGLTVRYEPVKSDLSGFLYRDWDGGEPVIGVNSWHGEARQRFTIAHELGHFLLHRSAGLRVDRGMLGRLGATPEGMTAEEEARAAEETEANVFAMGLLLPEGLLERELERCGKADLFFAERAISGVARRLGVSVQMVVLRMADLGWIER